MTDKSVACMACGSTKRPVAQRFDLRGRFHTFSIIRCTRCGLGVTDPLPSEDPYATEAQRELSSRTLAELRRDLVDSPIRSPWAREAARFLMDHRAPQPILDVGCGEGDLLDELRAGGYTGQGIELRPAAARLAREGRGLDVQVGSIESYLRAPARVGTIVLCHVLEHLPDPVGTIRRLSEHASMIAVAVPNTLSVRALIEWSACPGAFAYAPKEHLWQMTLPALARIFERAALEVMALEARPLRAQRRSLVDTLLAHSGARSAGPREDLTGMSEDAEVPRSLARRAVWQLVDRTLLGLERRTRHMFVADQVIGLARRKRNGSH